MAGVGPARGAARGALRAHGALAPLPGRGPSAGVRSHGGLQAGDVGRPLQLHPINQRAEPSEVKGLQGCNQQSRMGATVEQTTCFLEQINYKETSERWGGAVQGKPEEHGSQSGHPRGMCENRRSDQEAKKTPDSVDVWTLSGF